MRRSVYHAAKAISHFLWVRFHMTLILVAVVVIGLAANRLALFLGLRAMGLRYPMSVLVGYGAFFLGIKLWLGYAEAALSPGLRAELVRIDGDPRPSDAADARKPWWERLNLDVPDPGDGEGCLFAVIALVVVVLVVGVGAYLVGEAPFFLGEALVQVSLAAALRARKRRVDSAHWSGAVLRATWVPALIVLALSTLAGLLLHAHCPSAVRAAEALLSCREQP
jgi:hypothetical protein